MSETINTEIPHRWPHFSDMPVRHLSLPVFIPLHPHDSSVLSLSLSTWLILSVSFSFKGKPSSSLSRVWLQTKGGRERVGQKTLGEGERELERERDREVEQEGARERDREVELERERG